MHTPLLFGPYGNAALAHIDKFQDFGANALWFHGFNAEAFETCAQHDIAACVEFKTFRADFEKYPELIPIGVDGSPIRYGRLVQGVCLSQETFLAEIESHLLAGVQTFQPAGIWLDYLTYAGWFETPEPDLQESCFCPACIAEFCEASGLDATMPSEILTHNSDAWTRHKCQRIANFAQHYANLIHTYLPDCIVGAYMCPWTPDEFEHALRRIFAQDYALLAPAIDVFTPLIYAKKCGRSPNWAREFLETASTFVPEDRNIQLILDFLDFPDSLLAMENAFTPGWGVQIFGGDQIFSDTTYATVFRDSVLRIREKSKGPG